MTFITAFCIVLGGTLVLLGIVAVAICHVIYLLDFKLPRLDRIEWVLSKTFLSGAAFSSLGALLVLAMAVMS